MLKKYCSTIEIGNHYWEYEDNCILNNGIDIDILYRNLDDFSSEISLVVDKLLKRIFIDEPNLLETLRNIKKDVLI